MLVACNGDGEKDKSSSKQATRKIEQVVEHYPNGLKKIEGETVNGQRHGVWKAYYENGFLWSEGSFWYGKRKGYSIVYHENGKKKMEGDYKNGLKVGAWKIWNADGSLFKSINMDELLTAEDSLKLELK